MKNNTNELNSVIMGIISPRCTCAYQDMAKPTTYPYAVFDTQQLSSINGKTQARLEINIFAKSHSTIETLADNIEADFDHRDVLTNTVAFSSYKGQRLNIQEEDKTTYRIRLTIDLQLYGREE